MGFVIVLCDGFAVCRSAHGLGSSVQGAGDLGCSDSVLDVSDHVALDDQVPQNRDLMSMPYSQWAPIMEYVIIGGSVIFWILLLQSGKEKRRSYGLNSEHWNISIRMILLFIGLYLLRFVIACALSGQLSEFGKIMANPTTLIIFFTVLVNFFLSVVAFFGEEYGWRYYLQPLLQKKFGLKGGVILLGCVWAVWHLPIALGNHGQGARRETRRCRRTLAGAVRPLPLLRS